MNGRPDARSDRGGERDPPIGFRRDPAEPGPAWLKPVLFVLGLVAIVALAIALVTVGGNALFTDWIGSLG